MRKVLVVDDDPLIPRLVGAALKENGLDHQLDYCSDGGQGRIKAARGDYDLIVLDITMPFMNGVEALEEMKRNPKSTRTPVLVLTAMTDPALLDQMRALGAAVVINKPFEHWELAQAVRVVLAGGDLGRPAEPGLEAGR